MLIIVSFGKSFCGEIGYKTTAQPGLFGIISTGLYVSISQTLNKAFCKAYFAEYILFFPTDFFVSVIYSSFVSTTVLWLCYGSKSHFEDEEHGGLAKYWFSRATWITSSRTLGWFPGCRISSGFALRSPLENPTLSIFTLDNIITQFLEGKMSFKCKCKCIKYKVLYKC